MTLNIFMKFHIHSNSLRQKVVQISHFSIRNYHFMDYSIDLYFKHKFSRTPNDSLAVNMWSCKYSMSIKNFLWKITPSPLSVLLGWIDWARFFRIVETASLYPVPIKSYWQCGKSVAGLMDHPVFLSSRFNYLLVIWFDRMLK